MATSKTMTSCGGATAAVPAHNEAWLLALALNGTAVHVERVVRLARRHCEQEASDLARKAGQQRRVAWRWDADGSLIIEGRLPAKLGALVVKALEAATEPPSKAPAAPESVTAVTSLLGETLVQRRADALVAVAESFWATGYREGLACDASLVVMPEDSAGNVLHVGRRTSTIPRPSHGRSGAITAAAASRMDNHMALGALQTLTRRARLTA